MKIQLKNKSARVVIISLDDIGWGILPRKILPAFLQATEEAHWDINAQQWAEIKEHIQEHVWKKLLDYLAYRERSEAECYRWMVNLPCHPQLIACCLEQAKKHNYLDDERFAALFTQSLIERQKSEREIRHKLHEKGIENHLIDYVISAYYNEQKKQETAHAILHRKWNQLHMHPIRKRKEKILQFMMRKGFTYDDVADVLHELMAEEDGHENE